ncbi:MAG: hypothetical protein JWQ03_106 [Variovorax sp.]|nr:hypothetical protein [Variovorax sp.]
MPFPNSPPPERSDADSPVAEARVIPLVAEQVEVSKVTEHIGSVRFRKVVHHEDQPVAAMGYREIVETTRVPVNQAVEAPVAPHRRGDVYVIPVYEERLVKQLFLTEEIHVTQRREPWRGDESVMLRREEIVIERLDPVTQKWTADPDPA